MNTEEITLYKGIPRSEIKYWIDEKISKILHRGMYEVEFGYLGESLYIYIDECMLTDFIEINKIVDELINANTGQDITLESAYASLKEKNGGFFPKITILINFR